MPSPKEVVPCWSSLLTPAPLAPPPGAAHPLWRNTAVEKCRALAAPASLFSDPGCSRSHLRSPSLLSLFAIPRDTGHASGKDGKERNRRWKGEAGLARVLQVLADDAEEGIECDRTNALTSWNLVPGQVH